VWTSQFLEGVAANPTMATEPSTVNKWFTGALLTGQAIGKQQATPQSFWDKVKALWS
jgi:hypothetical protein